MEPCVSAVALTSISMEWIDGWVATNFSYWSFLYRQPNKQTPPQFFVWINFKNKKSSVKAERAPQPGGWHNESRWLFFHVDDQFYSLPSICLDVSIYIPGRSSHWISPSLSSVQATFHSGLLIEQNINDTHVALLSSIYLFMVDCTVTSSIGTLEVFIKLFMA